MKNPPPPPSFPIYSKIRGGGVYVLKRVIFMISPKYISDYLKLEMGGDNGVDVAAGSLLCS